MDNVGIDDVDGFGVGHITFTEGMEALSSAVLNGGSTVAHGFFIMQVPRDYDGTDPVADAKAVRDALGLPEDSIGMMTAAEVRHVFNIARADFGGMHVEAVATAGLSNQVVAGEVLDNYPERRVVSDRRAADLAGTINIAVISPVPLTDEGRVNIFMPLVEAKTAAMADRGYRETGTTSDSMVVFSPVGEDRVSYTGTGSDIGIAAARAVRRAVGTALERRGEHPVMEEPTRVLRNAGYGPDRLSEISGMPAERSEAALLRGLSDPGLRALLDLVMFVGDRAESMAADGDPSLKGVVIAAIESVTGKKVDGSPDVTEAALAAIIRHGCE